jgi:hypothetical protein
MNLDSSLPGGEPGRLSVAALPRFCSHLADGSPRRVMHGFA